jgi:hypothetical protein
MMYLDKCRIFQKKPKETNIYQNLSHQFNLFGWQPMGLLRDENKRSEIIQKKIYPKSTYCSEGKKITQSVDVVEVLGNFAQAGM